MNTPTEPPDSVPKQKRHLSPVSPLGNEPQDDQPTLEPESTYRTPWQVKLIAGTFSLFVGATLSIPTYKAIKEGLEQRNGAVVHSIDNTQTQTRHQVAQTIAIYPDGHPETVAEKDQLAEMYPDQKDLCTARIISMTKQIKAETGGVLPPDLIVVAHADGVHCKHDEKKGKFNLEFTQ